MIDPVEPDREADEFICVGCGQLIVSLPPQKTPPTADMLVA